MIEHIGIGMAKQTAFVRNIDPTQYEPPPRLQDVGIVTVTYTYIRHTNR